MLKFKLTADNRKLLVSKIAELTGETAKYMGMPSMEYEVGLYTVEKDGTLLAEEADDITAALIAVGMIAEPETVEDEEEPDEAESEEPDEDEEEEDEEEDDEEGSDEVIFDLPLEKHTAVSLRNLVNLFYSRGEIVNRAIGSAFHVEKELTDSLRAAELEHKDVNAFLDVLDAYELEHGNTGIVGIAFDTEEGLVSFSGFPYCEDGERIKAWATLISAMNTQAVEQKRIQAKDVDLDNEKYSFRCWLTRIGLNGDKYKGIRRILMDHLSGHSAFKTAADAERAKEKLLAKRKAAKAAQTAVEAAETSETEAEQPAES